tara:strand:+ start:474 stop:677 length:204 start_codon:yes stop_codon:yes gene_type:complete
MNKNCFIYYDAASSAVAAPVEENWVATQVVAEVHTHLTRVFAATVEEALAPTPPLMATVAGALDCNS